MIGMALLLEGILKYVIGLLDWEKTTSGMFTFCITTVEKNSLKLLEVAFFHSSIAIILMGKRELVALLYLSSFVMLSGSSSRYHGVVCGL